MHSSGVPGTDGEVFVTAMWDRDGAGPMAPVLVVGGVFTRVGDVPAHSLAAFDPVAGTWSSLGAGMLGGRVRALATMPNGDLVAAGYFQFDVGGTTVHRIARWNGTSWSALGGGLTGNFGANVDVEALAVLPNGDLVAGGSFDHAGGVPVGHLARWNGTAWADMGAGFAYVHALAVLPNGDLVVGGEFSRLNSLGNNVARWDGTTWFDLTQGIGQYGNQNRVSAFAVLGNGDLIAGGMFYSAGGVPTNSLARWNGTSWSAVVGLPSGAFVNSIATLANGDLAVGGNFGANGPVSANLARWSGTAWSSLGPGAPLVKTSTVLPGGDVVVGGSFLTAGGATAKSLARWNGSVWSSMGSGWNGAVRAFAVTSAGQLVAGGDFTVAGTAAASRLAIWNGAWTSLGGGVSRPGFQARVNAIAPLPGGHLVVGGDFSLAGGIAAHDVARWDGTAWSALGSGTNIRVQALAVLGNGDVVAGGTFQAPYISRWNGAAWSSLGSGMNATVFALAVMPNGDLIAGGAFTSAGGAPNTNYIARWDGVAWSPLGTGMSGTVRALAVMPNGDLIAGGDFLVAGGVPANYVARWNGTAWQAIGHAGATVRALRVLPNGLLAAGGDFAWFLGTATDRVAFWDGTSWLAAPAGLTGPGVFAIAPLPNGYLAVGGGFVHAGDPFVPVVPSAHLAHLSPPGGTCPASALASGYSCNGVSSVLLWATELPWLGGTYRSVCGPVTGGYLGVSVLGFGATNTPLASLHPAGLAGCSLLVSPDAAQLLVPTSGRFESALGLPSDPGLVGLPLHHQVLPLALDTAGQLTELTASNPLLLTLGAW